MSKYIMSKEKILKGILIALILIGIFLPQVFFKGSSIITAKIIVLIIAIIVSVFIFVEIRRRSNT